jgi:hypothetical protein
MLGIINSASVVPNPKNRRDKSGIQKKLIANWAASKNLFCRKIHTPEISRSKIRQLQSALSMYDFPTTH